MYYLTLISRVDIGNHAYPVKNSTVATLRATPDLGLVRKMTEGPVQRDLVSLALDADTPDDAGGAALVEEAPDQHCPDQKKRQPDAGDQDRKSTRLNSVTQ